MVWVYKKVTTSLVPDGKFPSTLLFSDSASHILLCYIPPIPYTVEYHSELESESFSYSSSQHCAMSVESQRWKYIAFSDPRASKIHPIAAFLLKTVLGYSPECLLEHNINSFFKDFYFRFIYLSKPKTGENCEIPFTRIAGICAELLLSLSPLGCKKMQVRNCHGRH